MNIDVEDLLVVEKIEEVEVPKIVMGRNKNVVNKTLENKVSDKRNSQNN